MVKNLAHHRSSTISKLDNALSITFRTQVVNIIVTQCKQGIHVHVLWVSNHSKSLILLSACVTNCTISKNCDYLSQQNLICIQIKRKILTDIYKQHKHHQRIATMMTYPQTSTIGGQENKWIPFSHRYYLLLQSHPTKKDK